MRRFAGMSRYAGKLDFAFLFIAAILATFIFFQSALPVMTVVSGSMEPTLSRGDMIVVKRADASEIVAGDVVVFSLHKLVREKYGLPEVIAHRVVEIRDSPNGQTFRTKGDAMAEDQQDPFSVLPQDVIGKMERRVPALGYLFIIFQSRNGTMLFFLLVAMYVVWRYGDHAEYYLSNLFSRIDNKRIAEETALLRQEMRRDREEIKEMILSIKTRNRRAQRKRKKNRG